MSWTTRPGNMASSPSNKRPELDGDVPELNVAAENDPIHIDPNGNLQLIVGPDAVKMQVDANALRRASKVFSRMLFGSFVESQQTAEWTVELPEDDPEPLTIIFHAAHGNLESMPQGLELSELYDLTMMADKYAMMDSLRPWATAWISGLKHPNGLFRFEDQNKTSYQDLQGLSILYFLGAPSKFEDFFAKLVVKSRANANGVLLFTIDEEGLVPGGEWRDIGLLSDTIIKIANTLRYQLIEDLLYELKTIFRDYTSEAYMLRSGCLCRSTALGLMIRYLVQDALSPLPGADEINSSAAELSNVVDKIGVRIKRIVIDRCGCELRLPHGLERSRLDQLEGAIHRRFAAHFAERTVEEASGN